jgi:hypothetical protein
VNAADLIKQTETLLDARYDPDDAERMARAQVVAILAVAEALRSIEQAIRGIR